MSEPGLDPMTLMNAARGLRIDAVTAEIAQAFESEGIETVVLKGPVFADWLYPGELRRYGDSDLMVSPSDWKRAVAVLQRLGFSDYLGPMAHPRMESFASTGFLRGEQNVDLHCAIHGLEGDLESVWTTFSTGSHQLIGGAELRVPPRAALLLHIGLHAAHHAEGKALEDLQRAIAQAHESEWHDALELARQLQGVPAFASGLHLVGEGAELAQRLGIEDVRSAAHEIRYEQVPTAEAINALLAPGVGLAARVRMILLELFPRPEFMRWRSQLARRGPLGLIVSYPVRWAWLALHAPRGLLVVRRVRRSRHG